MNILNREAVCSLLWPPTAPRAQARPSPPACAFQRGPPPSGKLPSRISRGACLGRVCPQPASTPGLPPPCAGPSSLGTLRSPWDRSIGCLADCVSISPVCVCLDPGQNPRGVWSWAGQLWSHQGHFGSCSRRLPSSPRVLGIQSSQVSGLAHALSGIPLSLPLLCVGLCVPLQLSLPKACAQPSTPLPAHPLAWWALARGGEALRQLAAGPRAAHAAQALGAGGASVWWSGSGSV